MGRTLVTMLGAALMCFALAACSDDTPQSDGEILQPSPEAQQNRPSRTPGSGQPPQGGVEVEETQPPPDNP